MLNDLKNLSHGSRRGGTGVLPESRLPRPLATHGGGDRAQLVLSFVKNLMVASDPESILKDLIGGLVPAFADWCIVNLVSADGVMERFSDARSVPPFKDAVISEIRRRFPPIQGARLGLAYVIRSGEAQLVEHFTPEMWLSLSRDPDYLKLWTALEVTSYMGVPIRVRGKVIGGIAFESQTPGLHYSACDLAFAEEIAALMSLAVERSLLLRETAAAAKAKDEFLATISHELRTPSNVILGWAQILQQEESLDAAERQNALATIERQAIHQARLVDDILDLTLVHSSGISLRKAPLDLVQVVQAAVTAVQSQAVKKGVTIELRLEVVVAPYHADHGRLLQACTNLLSNAIKFSMPGGAVFVQLNMVEGGFEVTVTDNGVGIAETFLPFVFDLFRQENATMSRGHGGLGAGLFLAKYLAELHGGHLTASSPGSGQGATFKITLPLEAAPPRVKKNGDLKRSPTPTGFF